MMFSPLRQLVRRMHSAFRRGRPSQARGGRLRFYRPRIDTLEERQVPTVWTVTNLLDNVAGSLRAEVFQAQNGDTVQFADDLQGQITLTTGEIAINHSIDIEGPGADIIQVSGNQNGRVFNVVANQTVSISSLTIKDARLTGNNGGGIANSGTLTLNDCVVSGNHSDGGGAIVNVHTLTLNRCAVTDNTAIDGGGILNAGILTINASSIDHNTATDTQNNTGGGGIINSGTISATDSVISDNTAPVDGGGIFQGSASTYLTRCVVADNQARLGGGISSIGLFFTGDSFLSVTGSTITGNTASAGGGGIFSGPADNTEVRDLIASSSTFANNSTAGNGGGIDSEGDAALLTDDTFVGNVAANGSGIYNRDKAVGSVGMMVVSCTIAGNSTTGNGGGLDEVVSGSTTTTLENTIVAGNTAAAGNDIYGPLVTTSDYNFVGDGNGLSGLIDGVNGNQVGFYGTIDPLLDPNGLQDHGGPTQTIALLAGSPALNVGAPDLLGSPDQRGVLRSGGVNIGAYQASATAFLVAAPDTVEAGAQFDVTVTAVDPFGQVAVGYLGTVTFSSSDMDPGVVLPPDYPFQASDAGMATFPGEVTLITPGDQTLTATDTVSAITGMSTVTVTGGGGAPGPGRPGPNLAAALREGPAAPAKAFSTHDRAGKAIRPAAGTEGERAPLRAEPVGGAAHRAALIDHIWTDPADLLLTGPWMDGLELDAP